MQKLSLALILVLIAALFALPGNADATYPITLTDVSGADVAIAAQPQTVVSLSPSNTEILFALGVGDKVVGVDAYSDYPPEAAAIENKVGDYSGPNVELIVSLKPDVVFASNNIQADAIEKLRELGMNVLSVDATAYEAIPTQIQLVASAMGVDAQPLLAQMADSEAQTLAAIGEVSARPRVYFALGFGEMGDWSVGTGSFLDDMIKLLSADNAVGETPVPWVQFSLEQLINVQPDVVILTGDETTVEAFKAAEGYKELKAVKENRVYCIDANITGRPGPRVAEALRLMAAAIYPDKFAN